MHCPNCNIELVIHKHTMGEVDICPKCKGIWFKNKNLQPYLIHLHNTQDIPHADKSLSKNIIHKYNINEKAKKCPNCKEEMEFFNYAYDSNVIIDECIKCNGFWVDENETYNLAVHLKGNPKMRDFGNMIIQDTKSGPFSFDYNKHKIFRSEFIKIIPMLIFAFIILVLGLIFIYNYYGYIHKI